MLAEIISDNAKNTPSIATNYKNKANKRANFMSFFDALGKSQDSKKTKQNKTTTNIAKTTNLAAKESITKNIKQNIQHSNIAQNTKNMAKNIRNAAQNATLSAKNPPNATLERNTNSKNIANIAKTNALESNQTSSNIANKSDFKTLSFKDSAPSPINTLLNQENKDFKIIKTAINTESKDSTKSVESLKTRDTADSVESPKEILDSKIAQKEAPKQNIIEPKIAQNRTETPKNADSIKKDSTQDSTPKNASNAIKDDDNAQNPHTPQNNTNPTNSANTGIPTNAEILSNIGNLQGLQNPQIAPKTADSQNQNTQNTQIAAENTKNVAPNFTPLGIQNTLKYGAFKAFDALSLLKPSNGKKISELIKKADELALNLEKIKYSQNTNATKPAKSEILPPQNERLQNEKLMNNTQNKNDEILKEALNAPQKTQDTPNVATKETPKEPQEAIKNNKQEVKNPPNEPKNTQNTESKTESKIESKMQDSQKDFAKDSFKDSPKDSAQENKNETSNAPKEPINSDIKPVSFKTKELKDIKEKVESNDKSAESKTIDGANNLKSEQLKAEQTQRIFDAKETMKSFVSALKQEIINYKPPLSKITLELHPANLGSVEVSITHQGKNIQVALNANQNTLNLFIQNQGELRAALNQIGYDNVTMSFSNGSQSGFSDSKGKWSFYENPNAEARNENSFEDEMTNLEITIINNYA